MPANSRVRLACNQIPRLAFEISISFLHPRRWLSSQLAGRLCCCYADQSQWKKTKKTKKKKKKRGKKGYSLDLLLELRFFCVHLFVHLFIHSSAIPSGPTSEFVPSLESKDSNSIALLAIRNDDLGLTLLLPTNSARWCSTNLTPIGQNFAPKRNE